MAALSAAVGSASATTPGWVDTTYGSNGVTVVPGALFGISTVDGTGRALVLGATSGTGSGGKVTRLTAGGQIDRSFGTSGTFALPSATFYTRLAIGPTGLIYVLGSDAANASPSQKFFVTRLTVDGAVDSTFGTAGTATVPAGATFTSDAFAVRNDGGVVVSLATSDAAKKGYLAALTPVGQLDTAFGPMGSTGIISLPDKTFVFKLAAAATPAAPVFTAASPPLSAIKGTAYRYTFAATGTPAPTFSVATGALPSGLTLDPATGVLSGTPTATGDFTFAVKAANGVTPDAVTSSFTIHVAPTPVAPVFTAATPPTTAKAGTAYTYTFAATGAPAPTFSLASGSLPPGLALNATTGVLSGTPTAGGAFTFTVKAANGVSPDAVTPSITIDVKAAPVFTAVTPPPTGNVGAAYSYTFAASGNPAPTFSVASGSLPPGLTLNSTTGVLSGVPSASGPFTFKVKAANGITPVAVSPSITITVNKAPTPPVFTAASPPSATAGVPYSYKFAANGYPAPTFSVIGNLPTGVHLNATTGVISGTPTAAHTFYFRMRASNGVRPDALTPLLSIAVARGPIAAPASPAGPAAVTPSQAPNASPADPTTTTPTADPNNFVVALVANDTGATRTFALQRYTNLGALDTTFGTGGSTAPFPAGVAPSAVAEASDGSYFVTGNDGQSVFLAHVLPNGQFDTAFGTGGVLVGPVESCSPTGGLLLLSGNSVYVLAVDTDASCGPSPAILLRFRNGAIDPTFGASGEVRVDSVAAMRVGGPNGGGLQPGGQVLIGLNGAAAPDSASAAVTRVITTAAGPTIEAFNQLVDDSHFAAATVAPNPAGTYVGPLGAAVDGAPIPATHVFALGANHHLYEFKQTGTTWSAPADLTAATTGAPTISSAPKAFFDGTTIDVFALGATGNLIEYRNNGAMGAWTATDINGAAPAGSPQVASTVDPHFLTGYVHVYGVTAAGHLVEVDNDNVGGHAWNFYDLTASAGGGTTIAGAPAAILLAGTPHVYTRAVSNGHLVEYVADSAGGRVWNAYDTTVQAPAAPAITGNPSPVLIGSTPHIYTISAVNGDLVEYAADGLGGSIWNAYDQTAGSGGAPKPVGNISVVLIDGTPYGIAQAVPEVWETPATGELTTFVADHQAGRIWNVYDVTSLSGGPQVSGDPTPIVNNGSVQVFGLGKGSATATSTATASTAGLGVGSQPARFPTWLPPR